MKHESHSPKNNRFAADAIDDADADNEHGDYGLVRDAIEFLSQEWREQPSLSVLSEHLKMGETETQKLFTRWAGLSPKQFLQAVTLDHAKRLLVEDELPLLDASFELGLSSPSRLHDLFVTHEAMAPGIFKAKGKGLKVSYGFYASPFGQALVMLANDALIGLGFCDLGEEAIALDDMKSRWPNADYIEDYAAITPMANKVFDRQQWHEDQPIKVTLIGTDFQISVWEALLNVPMGKAETYSGLAQEISKPKAVRAVGAAVGRNPISFVVPCHRALGKSGNLTGYHWGLTRKRAMLGWETGLTK